MGYQMKGMDFGTGQTHGAGNSPVKFWAAIGKAVATGAKKVGQFAAKKLAGKAGAGLTGKALTKAAAKGAGKLALKGIGGAAKKAAADSWAQHQEEKNRVPSNAPTVNF